MENHRCGIIFSVRLSQQVRMCWNAALLCTFVLFTLRCKLMFAWVKIPLDRCYHLTLNPLMAACLKMSRLPGKFRSLFVHLDQILVYFWMLQRKWNDSELVCSICLIWLRTAFRVQKAESVSIKLWPWLPWWDLRGLSSAHLYLRPGRWEGGMGAPKII